MSLTFDPVPMAPPPPAVTRAAIALGSNIGDSAAILKNALEALKNYQFLVGL